MQALQELLKIQAIQPKQQAKGKTSNNKNEELQTFTEIFKNECRNWSRRKEKPFLIDEENIAAVQALILYFTKHPEFENNEGVKGKPSLAKGIILCGNVGSGKTLIMQLLKGCFEYEHQFNMVPCDILTDAVRKEGAGALDMYQKLYRRNDILNEICFDDFGIEKKAKYYGDEISPIYDLIIKRYRLFCDNGLRTHFTTNLRPDEWETYYDNRTASRLHEMCNVIVLGGKKDSKDRRI